jgi:hypothetical protein
MWLRCDASSDGCWSVFINDVQPSRFNWPAACVAHLPKAFAASRAFVGAVAKPTVLLDDTIDLVGVTTDGVVNRFEGGEEGSGKRLRFALPDRQGADVLANRSAM